ncbi:MAG TPA: hypothetical protein VFB34_08740 [Chloroflexota bacterium]|nr:hypothetical protein [Chloroflexota bacterium]
MLRHKAFSKRFYVVWVDQPLPDKSLARYEEANNRVQEGMRRAFAVPLAEGRTSIDAEQMERSVVHVAEPTQIAESSLDRAQAI